MRTMGSGKNYRFPPGDPIDNDVQEAAEQQPEDEYYYD
jgi:hypothetical protein